MADKQNCWQHIFSHICIHSLCLWTRSCLLIVSIWESKDFFVVLPHFLQGSNEIWIMWIACHFTGVTPINSNAQDIFDRCSQFHRNCFMQKFFPFGYSVYAKLLSTPPFSPATLHIFQVYDTYCKAKNTTFQWTWRSQDIQCSRMKSDFEYIGISTLRANLTVLEKEIKLKEKGLPKASV